MARQASLQEDNFFFAFEEMGGLVVDKGQNTLAMKQSMVE